MLSQTPSTPFAQNINGMIKLRLSLESKLKVYLWMLLYDCESGCINENENYY